MTLREMEEQERLAYITGNVEKAKLLATIIEQQSDIYWLENTLEEMNDEVARR